MTKAKPKQSIKAAVEKEYFYPQESAKYIQRVKNNLRSFLFTQNYNIASDGGFLRRNKEANTCYRPMADLASDIEKKASVNGHSPLIGNPNNKLKKLLNDENQHLDPYVIHLICEIYHFPPESVYSSEEITPQKAELILAQSTFPKPFAPLSIKTHKSYFGTFYGYTYDHNVTNDERIITFRLSIFEDENGQPKAEYAFRNKANDEHIFTGTPYYLSELDSICIEMTSGNHRRYQHLLFNGHYYESSQLITYKIGCCTRTSRTSYGEPDVKSFILTSVQLPEAVVQNIVPGLLKMVGHNFYILSSTLNRLMQNNPNLKDFFENNRPFFTLLDNCVYQVDEHRLLKSLDIEPTQVKVAAFEYLALMRGQALAPNRIPYRSADADYAYFHQLKQAMTQLPTE